MISEGMRVGADDGTEEKNHKAEHLGRYHKQH